MWFAGTFFYILLAVYEFVPLYKQKLWRDFWVNGVLYIASFAFAMMLCFKVDIPSPSYAVQNVVQSILGR